MFSFLFENNLTPPPQKKFFFYRPCPLFLSRGVRWWTGVKGKNVKWGHEEGVGGSVSGIGRVCPCVCVCVCVCVWLGGGGVVWMRRKGRVCEIRELCKMLTVGGGCGVVKKINYNATKNGL